MDEKDDRFYKDWRFVSGMYIDPIIGSPGFNWDNANQEILTIGEDTILSISPKKPSAFRLVNPMSDGDPLS